MLLGVCHPAYFYSRRHTSHRLSRRRDRDPRSRRRTLLLADYCRGRGVARVIFSRSLPTRAHPIAKFDKDFVALKIICVENVSTNQKERHAKNFSLFVVR